MAKHIFFYSILILLLTLAHISKSRTEVSGVEYVVVEKGTHAADGYIWNKPPTNQVKCDNGAVFSNKEGGCICPPGKGHIVPLSVEKAGPAGVTRAHYGCRKDEEIDMITG